MIAIAGQIGDRHRGIGQGGWYADGDPRGPERVVQIKYSGNF